MKALITGASGFIGAHLAETLLARDAQVRCFVRRTSQTGRLRQLPVEYAYGDVLDEPSLRDAVSGVDVVFHLAGLIKALSYEELLRTNQDGAANVARACAAQRTPPVLVVVSSLAAAGPAPQGRLLTETDEPHPVSNYGRSKRAGEVAAVSFAGEVPITIVRPPIVFGEGDPAMIPLFRPIKWLGLHVVPGFTVRRLSMIHAADLSAGLVAAALVGARVAPPGGHDPAMTGYYYLAADEHLTHQEFGLLIGRALGRNRTLVVPAPEALLWGVGSANEALARLRGQATILNRDKVGEATAGSWTCAPDRARAELGFATSAPLAERFNQTASWYLREGWI